MPVKLIAVGAYPESGAFALGLGTLTIYALNDHRVCLIIADTVQIRFIPVPPATKGHLISNLIVSHTHC